MTEVTLRKTIRSMMRTMLPFAALLTASVSDLAAQDDAKPPKDYRKLVIANAPALFKSSVERGTMDISDLRPVQHYQGAEWMACLMTDTAGKPRKWAIYFHGETIVHVREALAIDRCGAEVYAPLKAEAKKPRAANKP
jgi:hypothetical protein